MPLTPIDWQNPIPTLAQIGIAPAELAALAGDRLLLFSLPPQDIQVPARGKLRDYPGAVFSGGALVVPAAATEIMAKLTDFPSYASMIPNTTQAQMLATSGPHTLMAYTHSFKLSVLTFHTHIQLQHTRESDGSLSAHLLDGDIDAAVSRWEAISLGPKKTLLVFLNWADVASANLVLQMLMKAQPDLARAAPVGAAFVAMDAFRSLFSPNKMPAGKLLASPVIPSFPRAEHHPLLSQLTRHGPVILIDAGQWLQDTNGHHCQRFVSVGCVVDSPLERAFRDSLQFQRFPEFFPLVQKAVLRGRMPEFSADWQVGIGLGVFSLGVNYRLAYQQPSPTRLNFVRESGDLARIDGCWDWQAINDHQSLGSMTIGFHIGSEPPLTLRFAQNLPHHDVIAGIYMALSSMSRLQQWLPNQPMTMPSNEI